MRQVLPLRCEDVWREISDYLDNNVDLKLRERLDAHFTECRHCAAILDGTRNVIALMNDGTWLDVPTELGAHLYARLQRHLSSKK